MSQLNQSNEKQTMPNEACEQQNQAESYDGDCGLPCAPDGAPIKQPKLWNRNFGILTIGSFVSMLGYTCATFALSLLVLDETESVFFYAITLVCSMLPRLVMPMVAGTFFDRHSRRKAIPRIDYCYATTFAIVTLLLYFDCLAYWILPIISLVLGSLDGMYMVAFDSLFPLLTTTQNMRKAYSINSMLYPVASIISAPLTLVGYEMVGAKTLFTAAFCLFALTATVEMWIKVREPHLVQFRPQEQAKLPPSPREIEHINNGEDITQTLQRRSRGSFFTDFSEGVKYLFSEKGLLAITLYFFVISLCGSIQSTLIMPYFKFDYISPNNLSGMWTFMIVSGASTLGRIIGASVQYRYKFAKEVRYNVAVIVYMTVNAITIIVFHLPFVLMTVCMFVEGTLSVTSYNIRISSTSNFVPDEKRGRFNGAFLFFNMLGGIVGQLIAAGIGDIGWHVPSVMSVVFAVNLLAVFLIILPAKKHIAPIYNTSL